MESSPETAAPPLAFERLAEIAVGATARIELCRVTEGPRTGQLVVAKRLHPHVADDPQFLDMFRDEAWMTAALEHQHVVQVVGWGVDDQGPYLAAEFVRGVSLARLMKTVFETGEQFSERQVVYLGACICDGLAAAHSLCSPAGELLNLVHRDMTPGNVLLGFDGQVKIADFGLAKARMRLTKTLTGLLKGQPHYMAPEQIKSQPLDGRTDIFAFGVVLYELFAGRHPWNATSDLEAMRATMEQEAAPLDKHRPNIDKALVALVDKCLQKDPAARFQTADVLRDEFAQWLQAHGYREDNDIALARFVRRNAMRQMRWFDRAMAGHFSKGVATDLDQSDTVAASPQGMERPDHGASVSVPPSAASDSAGGAAPPPVDDWGEEGPTLIQGDQRAKGVLRRITEGLRRSTRSRGPGRRRLPTAPTIVGRDGVGPAPAVPSPIEDEPSIPEMTTLRRHGPDNPALGVPLTPSHPPPGVVAPHDPAVPPVPPPSGSGASGSVPVVVTPLEVPASAEIVSEAQRLAQQAASAAELARHAAGAADAASRAAALAGEAVLLATSGQQSEALERLNQARQIDAQLAVGQAPMDELVQLGLRAGRGRWIRSATLQRWHAALVAMLSREGIALFGVLLLGILLVVLFWALLR